MEHDLGEAGPIGSTRVASLRRGRFRISFAVELTRHWEPGHDSIANLGPPPSQRFLAIPLRPCVDLTTVEKSEVKVWIAPSWNSFKYMGTTAVSRSIDLLLEQQAGCVRGLVSCRERAAPDNVKNFGSALGLSCERVRGRSPARPAEMADAVGR